MLKDSLDQEGKCGVIYECKCEQFSQLYVSEMERSLGERVQEHDKSVKEGDSKSALSQHQVIISKQLIEGVRVIQNQLR